MNIYRTAESVTPSHPDKICDQISDAILDECLKQDPKTRVAIEVMGGHGIINITGELSTNANFDIRTVAQNVYRDLGYRDNIGININIVKQSSEIGRGVDNGAAGDQGIMVGYACDETPELLPLEVVLSRKLTQAMGKHDGKAQITTKNGKVIKVLTSTCESGDQSDVKLREIFEKEILPHCDPTINEKDLWLRNPNGEWLVGGFEADTGLTGRKLAVDNYGPNIPVGGGCFSGKDATKVDRSGAYIARRIAVDYLKSRKAKQVFVHIAYALGVVEPLMAVVTVDGVQEEITGYDLRPRAIIEFLELDKPQFRETARFGHFGNGFRWDK
jgi:S-adenosylmethionine synthetase